MCPAEYDLGEDLKIAILSIPEGDDKKVVQQSKEINSKANVFNVSLRTGNGLEPLVKYIDERVKIKIK